MHVCFSSDIMDDEFDKKKDDAPMLDLSKVVINTPEEYRAVMDKVPDFKTRPEKVNLFFWNSMYQHYLRENNLL